MVDASITVLGACGEAHAVVREVETVDGPKVATHRAQLVLVNLMVPLGLEFTHAGICGGHSASILASTQDDVVLGRRDGRSIHWGIGLVCLQALHCLCVEEFGTVVQRCSDEGAVVLG